MKPAAILLDYGGVIADVQRDDGGYLLIAAEVERRLAEHGLANALSRDEIEADVRAGVAAYEAWKRAQSRRMRPREMRHREFWELVAADWPAAARRAVMIHAVELCACVDSTILHRPAKTDAAEVLQALRARGIRLALVCNALSAEAARRQMRRDGLTGLLDAEWFSDEVGIRKPNPEFLLLAAASVGVAPEACWLVGDTYDRDILGARRAGLGKAILMGSPKGSELHPRVVVEDVRVNSLRELLLLVDRE